ncbi:hypothetical protein BDR26DRAFT_213079 [Obelidium mucronatum]|nr:hypothetical protein BDR26DRAFT_213079 [Obelidium mucronatum]
MSGFVDIKALALLWRIDHKAGATATRADKHGWILQNLYRPMTAAELLNDPYFQILDLSTDKEVFEWANEHLTEEEVPLTAQTPQFTHSSADQSEQLFRLTPSTRIYAMAQKHRVSIVVDVSASMRVVDASANGLNRALIPLCFETLCNCLDGISRPYTVNNSWTGDSFEVRPEIYVTIIAKGGASMGYRPDLSPRAHAYITRHPIHVILQDVQVTSANLFSVTEWLYNSLNEYENEMISLRHMDDKSGSFDPQYPLTNPHQSVPSQVSVTSFESFQKPPNFNEPSPLNTLEYGLLALRLLPSDCKPILIVLTDGVSMSLMKGEFIYRDVCRRLARDIVHVTIIQIGSTNGFYPEVNFGYVPDNEALRFLALAAFGKFIYSSDCKYLDPAVIGDTLENPISLAIGVSPPNFYHRHILIRETHLQKSKHVELYRFVVGAERPVDTPRIRFINSNMEASMMPEAMETEHREIGFPWNTESVPPVVGEILCGYKDYTVESQDLSGLIHTRLLEGFAVKSIHIGNSSGVKKHGHGSKSGSDKVEIILMRPWLPNVTIQYTIKARFNNDMENSSRPFLSRAIEGKAPRIELNILAHHSFAINFVNIEGGVKNERLLKLHHYLHGIHESDALVKILIAFNQKSVMSLIPKFDPRLFTSSIGAYGWGSSADC